MKDRYSFLAVLTFAEDGISIEFPDLPGCLSCADTQEEAIHNAQEVLSLWLCGMEQDGEVIPPPTPIHQLALESNQTPLLVSVYMPLARKQVKTASIRKTISIPAWLNAAALERNINFSQVLQEALKERIGMAQ